MKKTIILLLAQLMLITQMSAHTEDFDYMHCTGKIYVVVAVLVTIFLIIIGFLIYLERKLTKLESLIED